MTIGPGKYDDLCADVAEKCGVKTRGGAAFVIVVNGNKGNGFSCWGDFATMHRVPELLEHMAKQIRADLTQGSA